jgi:hypothetical protein
MVDAALRRVTASPAHPHRAVRAWRVARAALVVWLTAGIIAGVASAAYGLPRRLFGAQSPFVLTEWQERFVRHEDLSAGFTWAADPVKASGARRIGLVEDSDSWEYPWWLLLRGDGRKIVAMQSQLPKHPPATAADIDGLVCQWRYSDCLYYTPKGWTLHWKDGFGWAIPPKAGSPGSAAILPGREPSGTP